MGELRGARPWGCLCLLPRAAPTGAEQQEYAPCVPQSPVLPKYVLGRGRELVLALHSQLNT